VSDLLFFVVSGDPSGDLHASNLIRALKRQAPSARVAAIGGPLTRAVADEFLEDLASRGMTGFWEPARRVPFLLGLAKRIAAFLETRRPTAVICVDFYGFNRRVLSLAHTAGLPAFYFISPQVWATRPGRIAVIKRLVRRIFVIFPFEEPLYRDAGVPVTFVGHPLLDLIPEPIPHTGQPHDQVIGLLPGSRSSELHRHLPVFFQAFRRLRAARPALRGVLFAAPSLGDAVYEPLPEGVVIVRDHDYRARAALDAALCSSGTATLENALLGIPMVVVYKMSWITYAIARALVKVEHVAMANLLAGRRVVPELIQHEATPEAIVRAASAILDDRAKAGAIREELLAVRRSLGEPGAVDRVAEEILQSVRDVSPDVPVRLKADTTYSARNDGR
jgi:lipid-A-disaccharide synthase